MHIILCISYEKKEDYTSVLYKIIQFPLLEQSFLRGFHFCRVPCFQPEEIPLVCIVRCFCEQQIISLCGSGSIYISSSFLKDSFAKCGSPGYSQARMASVGKSLLCYGGFLVSDTSFYSCCFWDSSLSSNFGTFTKMCQWVGLRICRSLDG